MVAEPLPPMHIWCTSCRLPSVSGETIIGELFVTIVPILGVSYFYKIQNKQECGLIHQRFATTLLKSLIHKPFAYLGSENSKSTLNQMEEDINLITFGFMKERLKILLGVKDDERIPNKIFSLFHLNTYKILIKFLNQLCAPNLLFDSLFFPSRKSSSSL